MNKEKLKLVKVMRSEAELFVSGQPRQWKKGEISNPSWLKRENGHDFITINTLKELESFAVYMSREDERLSCAYYNTFTTMYDRAANHMIVCADLDENGDSKKVVVVVVKTKELVMPAVEIVETYCGTEI